MQKSNFKQGLFYVLLGLWMLWLLFYTLSVLFPKSKHTFLLKKGTNSAAPIFTHFSQLDGTGVATIDEEKPRVIGVMIDNHPDAWPAAGLSAASVVYEVPVEGGLTRFMALFNASTTVDRVGPVRSARPYYIDWIQEWGDAMYMHSGGSPDALTQIKNSDFFDTNEFWWGQYYWRDSERNAPHNLYTSSERWQKLLADHAGSRPEKFWSGWKFTTEPTTDATSTLAGEGVVSIQGVSVPYTPDHTVSWKYKPETGRYARSINNKLRHDADGTVLYADNVVVQYVDTRVIDEEGRREITTSGQGDLTVLNGGRMVKAMWRQNAGRTRWFYNNGSEIALHPGITWVEVVPKETILNITN